MEKVYFVFSDVHGEYDGLIKSLKEKGFDENNENHILFSLGDLWDRGPKNLEVAQFCIKFWQMDRFIGIMGNHDEFFKDYIRNTMNTWNIDYNGFGETLKQWAGEPELSDSFIAFNFKEKLYPKIMKNIPLIHEFIDSFKDKFEFGKYIFIHGGYSRDKLNDEWFINNWSNTPKFVLGFDTKDKIYVFGHWRTRELNKLFNAEQYEEGDLFIYKNFIGIDPTSVITKKVNVLILKQDENGEYILEL